MDLRKIKKLVEILEESQLAEIEITEEGESIRLSRQMQSMPQMPQYMPYPPQSAPAAPLAESSSSGGEAPSTGSDDPDLADGHVIRSPMVGTFYAAPNPESEPFVRTGQSVKAGDTVCVIEAMKMFNQIESDTDGKIVAVLVENGQPVEFDQPLFIVR